jgi:hypothetical protein
VKGGFVFNVFCSKFLDGLSVLKVVRMKFRKILTLLLAVAVTAVTTATLVESSRSLQGGDLSVKISLPLAGKGKADLIALKCSVLEKFGVYTSLCGSKASN